MVCNLAHHAQTRANAFPHDFEACTQGSLNAYLGRNGHRPRPDFGDIVDSCNVPSGPLRTEGDRMCQQPFHHQDENTPATEIIARISLQRTNTTDSLPSNSDQLWSISSPSEIHDVS